MSWLGRFLADDDHAAAGVTGGIQAQRKIAWIFSGVTGFGNDSVLLGFTGISCHFIALVPGGRETGAVDV
jgi:hypothetical protein